MIKLIDINLKNWKYYEPRVLESEKTFAESIRSNSEDFLEILMTPNSICKAVHFNNEYVGNIVGSSPSLETIQELVADLNDKRIPDSKIIYLYNFVLSLEFRGKGFGTSILKSFIDEAKRKGYSILLGHFRKGSSSRAIEKFGAEIIRSYLDWEGTGEEYVAYKLNL